MEGSFEICNDPSNTNAQKEIKAKVNFAAMGKFM